MTTTKRRPDLIRTMNSRSESAEWFNYSICDHILIPATYERTQKGQYEYIQKIRIRCMTCNKTYTLRIAIN